MVMMILRPLALRGPLVLTFTSPPGAPASVGVELDQFASATTQAENLDAPPPLPSEPESGGAPSAADPANPSPEPKKAAAKATVRHVDPATGNTAVPPPAGSSAAGTAATSGKSSSNASTAEGGNAQNPFAPDPAATGTPSTASDAAPRGKLKFFRLGTAINGSVMPSYFSYYGLGGGASVGFALEAGGFYRRRPRFGSGLLFALAPGGFYFIPDLTLAHRFHARRAFLANSKIRIESLFTADLGIRMPGYFIPGALVGIGWAARFVVRDKLELIVRPINLDLTGPSFTSFLYFDLRIGGALAIGYTF